MVFRDITTINRAVLPRKICCSFIRKSQKLFQFSCKYPSEVTNFCIMRATIKRMLSSRRVVSSRKSKINFRPYFWVKLISKMFQLLDKYPWFASGDNLPRVLDANILNWHRKNSCVVKKGFIWSLNRFEIPSKVAERTCFILWIKCRGASEMLVIRFRKLFIPSPWIENPGQNVSIPR